MKTNGKKLINTNPYLKNPHQVTEICLRNTSASCHIEGVYCKNIDDKLKHYSTQRRKSRAG